MPRENVKEFHGARSLVTARVSHYEGRGSRSGTVGGRSPKCFFWVLSKRSIPKPDQHGKDIQQESLGTDVL